MKVWRKTHWLPAHAYSHDTLGRTDYACWAWLAYPYLLSRCEVVS